MISKQFAKRRKDSAVSPVIATILMVAITVVLAAVLYVMVGGFTHNPGTANSAGLNEAQNSASNYTVTVSSISASNIGAANLKIVISGGTSVAGTYLMPAALNAVTTSMTGPATSTVSFVILSGNSPTYLSAGDYFNILAASGSSLSGATVTLYSGNSQLGTVTL